MTVKARKIKKVSILVASEQKNKRTFAWVVQTFGEHSKKYCTNRNHLIKPQSLNKHCDNSNIHLLFNSRNNSTLSNNDGYLTRSFRSLERMVHTETILIWKRLLQKLQRRLFQKL